MKIIEKWNDKLESQNAADFYNAYLETEKEVYTRILAEKMEALKGTVAELSKNFGMEDWVFAGFMDGINTSLKEPADIENLEEDTLLDLTIDFEKLYYNMINVKAEWLYTL